MVILSAMVIMVRQGALNNTRRGKRAQAKIISAAEDFIKRNSQVQLTNEDLQDIVGGDVDYVKEKYGNLKGWDALDSAIEEYFDLE